MRSEDEMMSLIVNAAAADSNVRAAVMNGSRVNPHARRDIFQDYDVVFYVRDVDEFKSHGDTPARFGEIMIMQTPEDMEDPAPVRDGHYVYLMQFADGNRIDLSLDPLDRLGEVGEDSLTVVLVDKDDLIGDLPSPSEKSYLTRKPTAKAFDDCCNEFWWLCPYVAKGLWREELTYAKYMLESVLRQQLMRMLAWYAGVRTNYEKPAGKLGKDLKNQIGLILYMELIRTYPDAGLKKIWDSLFAMGGLFRKVAKRVAKEHGFVYPEDDDANVSDYLGRIAGTSKDRDADPDEKTGVYSS